MLSWFRKVSASSSPQTWPLDMKLGAFNDVDFFRLSDAFTGVIVLGATGSGKSSGAGEFFLKNFINGGLGGLALCSKISDRSWIEQIARECGRFDDLVVFEAGGLHRCNVLACELAVGCDPTMRIEAVVELFRTALEIAERDQSSGASSGDNKYFERACLQALRSALLVLTLGGEPVTLENIRKLMMSAPRTPEEARDPAWQARSYCYAALCKADDKAVGGTVAKDFQLSLSYWVEEFAGMDVKPRSSILSTYTTMADVLERGAIRECFFEETTITPEACRNGKIIVLDFPTLGWNATGQIIQGIFKFVWQRAQERLDVQANPRPVFLFADEFQQFLTRRDASFQATARSSRVCTVYLTQNLPAMYEAVGGESGRHVIDSLLGNLRLKVLFSQDDLASCHFQSELIGKIKRFLFNSNTQNGIGASFDYFKPSSNRSAGMSESWEYEIQPWEWSQNLRTGGPQNNFQVDGVVFHGGRIWNASGKTHLTVSFTQTRR